MNKERNIELQQVESRYRYRCRQTLIKSKSMNQEQASYPYLKGILPHVSQLPPFNKICLKLLYNKSTFFYVSERLWKLILSFDLRWSISFCFKLKITRWAEKFINWYVQCCCYHWDRKINVSLKLPEELYLHPLDWQCSLST